MGEDENTELYDGDCFECARYTQYDATLNLIKLRIAPFERRK